MNKFDSSTNITKNQENTKTFPGNYWAIVTYGNFSQKVYFLGKIPICYYCPIIPRKSFCIFLIFSDICARIEFVHRKKEIPKKYTFWEFLTLLRNHRISGCKKEALSNPYSFSFKSESIASYPLRTNPFCLQSFPILFLLNLF